MNDNDLHQQLHQPVYDRRGSDRDPVQCADHEKRLILTEQAVMSIKNTNEGLTTKMDLLLASITKIALLEEKHTNQSLDISRAHDKVGKLESAVDKLAIETRAFINYSQGRDKILWAIASVVFGLFVKALFFASSHGMTP